MKDLIASALEAAGEIVLAAQWKKYAEELEKSIKDSKVVSEGKTKVIESQEKKIKELMSIIKNFKHKEN